MILNSCVQWNFVQVENIATPGIQLGTARSASQHLTHLAIGAPNQRFVFCLKAIHCMILGSLSNRKLLALYTENQLTDQ